MQRKVQIINFLAASTLSLSLSACAGVPLKPGAENVSIVSAPIPVQQCQLKGQITAQTPNYAKGSTFTDKSEANAIKNAAQELGANVVVLNTDHQLVLPNNTNVHNIIGDAYLCTPQQ